MCGKTSWTVFELFWFPPLPWASRVHVLLWLSVSDSSSPSEHLAVAPWKRPESLIQDLWPKAEPPAFLCLTPNYLPPKDGLYLLITPYKQWLEFEVWELKLFLDIPSPPIFLDSNSFSPNSPAVFKFFSNFWYLRKSIKVKRLWPLFFIVIKEIEC